jgi:hypothetical protein
LRQHDFSIHLRAKTPPATNLRIGLVRCSRLAAGATRNAMAARSDNMLAPQRLRSKRSKAFLTCKGSLALSCGALVLSLLLARYGIDRPPDMDGWQMSDFLDHLDRNGLQFRVIPAAAHGVLADGVYLTEDPDLTWDEVQAKPRIVERIDQWRGTVRVGWAHSWIDVPQELEQSGDYGCRIGGFLLFGDRRLLRRIEEACRR